MFLVIIQRTYMEDGNGIYIDVYFEDVRKLYYELPNTNAFLISEYYYRPK